jgi:hypothetical protein
VSEQAIDKFIANAVDGELNYARSRIRDMRQQIERLMSTAESIVRQCDGYLTGEGSGEEPF